MFLSIIVPSYNVGPYVEDCLKSCVSQNYPQSEYEIIVINDGSKDNTLEVVNQFVASQQVENIRVVSQENYGLSATRNRGITLAQGDYVWFVDSDDWIAEHSIPEIAQIVQRCHQPEVVVLNAILRKDGTDQVIDRGLAQTEGDGQYVYFNSYIFPYSGAPFYVYNRKFLLDNNLTFKEGIYFEDCLFTPIILSRAKRCVYYSTPAYIYRLRESSITTSSISEKKLYDSITVAESLIENISNPQSIFKSVLQDATCRTYEVLFRYYILKSTKEVQTKFLSIVNSNKNWRSMLKGSVLKHKVYYLIMRVYSLLVC